MAAGIVDGQRRHVASLRGDLHYAPSHAAIRRSSRWSTEISKPPPGRTSVAAPPLPKATVSSANSPTARTTPLTDWHAAHGGRMVDFSGWRMPVQYTSIRDEHQATRTAIGLFDISHMGRLAVTGPDAAAFVDRLVTRRVTDLAPGRIRYGLVCNEAGGVLDDVLVYGAPQPAGVWGDHAALGVVVNAGNRDKLVAWFNDQRHGFDVQVDDRTLATAMIAVQGPHAIALIDALSDGAASKLKNYCGAAAQFDGHAVYLSRTGYTGEDGVEILCPADAALAIWVRLVADAAPHGGVPVGLGARDTLRLEAAMPLYGHELDQHINPFEAGLGFGVTLAPERELVGKEALAAAKANPARIRIGLTLEGRRVAREGTPVLSDGQRVGVVTSGTFSPTLQCPIALALIDPAAAGGTLSLDLRGTALPAQAAALPFYRRSD